MSVMPTEARRDVESIRLFKSDFMEFFTHISPVTIVVAWLPVALFLLVTAIRTAPAGVFPWHIPAGVLLGIALWSFTEYTLHRYVFHYEPRTPLEQRITFLFHGVHHEQPQDPSRLVMPLPVSIPLSFLFYGIFYAVAALLLKLPDWVNPLMVGFLIGYLMYDLTHYATHHFPMRTGYWKFIKRYHMAHHFKTPDKRFGVSSPLWDYVFGTRGIEE